jgi:hypothetical protein
MLKAVQDITDHFSFDSFHKDVCTTFMNERTIHFRDRNGRIFGNKLHSRCFHEVLTIMFLEIGLQRPCDLYSFPHVLSAILVNKRLINVLLMARSWLVLLPGALSQAADDFLSHDCQDSRRTFTRVTRITTSKLYMSYAEYPN